MLSLMPIAPRPARTMPPSESSSRSTIFSPKLVGPVAARMSNLRAPQRAEKVPSCGRRRSAMSMSATTFVADTSARPSEPPNPAEFWRTPSMRNRTCNSSPVFGSRWMSVARMAIALAMSCCTATTALDVSLSFTPASLPSIRVPSFFRSTTVSVGFTSSAAARPRSSFVRCSPCVAGRSQPSTNRSGRSRRSGAAARSRAPT